VTASSVSTEHATSAGVTSAAEREPARDIIVIDGSAHWSRCWADLYVYRGALWSLAWRNIRSRYKQAWLGATWALLQPAIQTGVFTILFGVLAGVPSGGIPYPVFALAGLLPWNLFAKVQTDGAISLVTNQHIIGKLFFPRIYLVLASGASALIDAAVTFLLLVAAMLAFDVPLSPSAIWGIPILLALLMFSYGLASLLAAINARWRDVQHTLPLLLQVGLFVTPVLYRNSFLPERWRWVLAANPMTGFVEGFRSVMLGLPVAEPRLLWGSLATSAALLVIGIWYFTRTETTIVDVV